MEPTRPDLLPDPALSRAEMEQLQHDIAALAVFEDGAPATPTPDSDDHPLVAGIDQAFLDDRAVSGVVVYHGDEIIERAHAVTECAIPYIPGLLAFREGGPIAEALQTLDCKPDLLCFDGSGRIHYRQAGLATHLGVCFEIPAIGVIKNLLCGTPQQSTENRPVGWKTPIVADESVSAPADTIIGYAYQSRQYDSERRHINPLYVSPGHHLRAETAVEWIDTLCDGYKLPKPIRAADQYVAECKRERKETT